MFTNMVRFVREWRHYKASVRELSQLGDRQLADLGINRSDITRVAWSVVHQR
jgi:uncharacterized protein YjiS (DUF1127 family)